MELVPCERHERPTLVCGECAVESLEEICRLRSLFQKILDHGNVTAAHAFAREALATTAAPARDEQEKP